MSKNNLWNVTVLPALAAFCVYTCMFAYRKPFTVAGFENLSVWGMDYKIALVIAQTVGYTLSKFYGIRFIAELKSSRRSAAILLFMAAAWTALLLFAVVPPPYNILFMVINGFPLGMIYGIVFSYLEGRRTTEFLGAVLATSFIFAAGFTQSIAKWIMLAWNVNQWWMPFVTGFLFFLPLFFFTRLLSKTPPPDAADVAQRTKRKPMNEEERKRFLREFLPGLVLLILSYVLLTVMRDYRSNFASNIWNELGYGKNAAVFTQSEIPASLVVLVLMSLLVLVKSNIRALLINHAVIVAGFLLVIVTALLYSSGCVSPFWWMTLTGVGLYLGYVPFNCMLFDRLIASFHYVSNAGFLIYVADSVGYLGSDAVLVLKNFWKADISWGGFFVKMLIIGSCTGVLLVLLSVLYFRKKHRVYSAANSELSYG